MAPELFGIEHVLYLVVSTVCASAALLMFKQIHLTYKKWYCAAFCFTAYITVGAFLMHTFDMSDAFHIAEPLLDDTPLTAWVMAPMFAVAYGLLLWIVELVRAKKAVTV